MNIYLGKIDHDRAVLPKTGIMVSKGNYPKMATRFRLVEKQIPRYMKKPIFSDGFSSG